MLGLTYEEAVEYCRSIEELCLSRDNVFLRFRAGPRGALVVQTPSHLRMVSALCLDLVSYQQAKGNFEGGLLWLGPWDFSPPVHRVGWRAIEAMRRVHGVNAPLEIAPATLFRADELIEQQAFLTFALAFGWSGYMVPRMSRYLLDLRASDRFFVHAETAEDLEDIAGVLKRWEPTGAEESGEPNKTGRRKPKRATLRKAEGR
jgi:hypothetical protein